MSTPTMANTPDVSTNTSATTTLFNFVTLRGVQRRLPSAHVYTTVSAPRKFILDSTISLRPVSNAASASSAKTARSVSKSATDFEKKSSYLPNFHSIQTEYGQFIEIGFALKQLRTSAQASELIQHISKIKPLAEELSSRLWNNLIYHALNGGDGRVYDALTSVALANYTVSLVNASKEPLQSGNVLELSRAYIALPPVVIENLQIAAKEKADLAQKADMSADTGAKSVRDTTQFNAAEKTKTAMVLSNGSIWASRVPHEGTVPVKPDPGINIAIRDNPFPNLPCCMQILNVAEYRRAEQTLLRYEAGEIAAIVNVLQGEYQERATRRLVRTEDSFLTRTESETTHETDNQSTDRFEMESATKKETEASLDVKFSGTVSGNYGTVSYEVETGVASHNATHLADQQAVKKTKEITARALDRVINKVIQERQSKRTEEFEDRYTHGYDNRAGSGHVVGSYRWVNKIYSAQVWTYGQRLSVTFDVDEPARFYKFSQTQSPGLTELIKPNKPNVASPSDLTDSNYLSAGAAYGLELSAPPAEFIYLSDSYHDTNTDNNADYAALDFSGANKAITIPEGYTATKATVIGPAGSGETTNFYFSLAIAGQSLPGSSGSITFNPGISSNLTVSYIVRSRNYFVSVKVECKRTAEALKNWQAKTFSTIMMAYQAQLDDYNAKLAEAKAQAGSIVYSADDYTIRKIITDEIKKACLRILGPDAELPLAGQDAFHLCREQKIPLNRIECPFCQDAQRAILLDSYLDWDLMITKFYEYFYADTCRWAELSTAKGSDAAMTAFLQAGFAKVTVPIAEGKEAAFLYYMVTGRLWTSATAPTFDDPIILDMLAEILPLSAPVKVGAPWELSVPTTLTVLECGSKCVEDVKLPLIGTSCPTVNAMNGKDIALPTSGVAPTTAAISP
ncbi:hypothetical protein H8L32_01745 [Undibacterium sp. CY18W]|uniref:Uncharacterized protein n=1 Tax=Undibacterium hunanense TaxID=2762292 RepID=A0ABR6ZJY3_9BURK|nr:hypothetical protein [Undibacterium hunanense]MBC3916197.1 hypothetical protein [Undibacterium hunanense]